MSERDYKTVIELSKRYESHLKRHFGAKGQGLHELVSSIEDRLSESEVRSFRIVATIRNRLVHEADYNELDFESKMKLERARGYIETAIVDRGAKGVMETTIDERVAQYYLNASMRDLRANAYSNKMDNGIANFSDLEKTAPNTQQKSTFCDFLWLVCVLVIWVGIPIFFLIDGLYGFPVTQGMWSAIVGLLKTVIGFVLAVFLLYVLVNVLLKLLDFLS